jgi:hypothetical protein
VTIAAEEISRAFEAATTFEVAQVVPVLDLDTWRGLHVARALRQAGVTEEAIGAIGAEWTRRRGEQDKLPTLLIGILIGLLAAHEGT